MKLSKNDMAVIRDMQGTAKKAALHLRDYGQKSLADTLLFQAGYMLGLVTKLSKEDKNDSDASPAET